MKKLSLLTAIALGLITVSAFSFCSDGKAASEEIKADSLAQKKEAKAVKAVKQKAPAKAKTVNSNNEKSVVLKKTVKVEDGMTWYTDLNKAHLESAKTGKPILGFFTGSDWCGWCFKLHDNVLVKEEFKKWADDNVVLMEIDFPRRTALDPELKKQNDHLQSIFGVRGFPTVWYFNTTMNEESGQLNLSALGKTGYPRSAPGDEAKTFIAASEQILNKDQSATVK